MVDYLTTDWNHKIKTNPVANLILNSNNSGKKIRIQHRTLANLGDIGLGRFRLPYDWGRTVGQPVWLTENEFNYLERSNNPRTSSLQYMSDDQKDAIRDRWAFPLLQEHDDAIDKRRKEILRRAKIIAKDRKLSKTKTRKFLKAVDVNKVGDDDEFKRDGVFKRTPTEIDDELGRGMPYHDVLETADDTDYWANCYVKDFINIQHPKLRNCHVSALSTRQVDIKPPSVFFSDI